MTKPHTPAMAVTPPRTAPINAAGALRGGRFWAVAEGKLHDEAENRKNPEIFCFLMYFLMKQKRRPVAVAAAAWMRYSHTPAREPRNTPLPAMPRMKAGPALLQNVSSSAPSSGVRSPCRTRLSAVFAPSG